jgi:hypothetical protein
MSPFPPLFFHIAIALMLLNLVGLLAVILLR